MKPSEVLRKAAERIGAPNAWAQGYGAKLSDGRWCAVDNPHARSWCICGAIDVETGGQESDFCKSIYRYVRRFTDCVGGVGDWNDRPEMTQALAVDALTGAAALAESEGQ